MKKKITASELMARLNADPEYAARRKASDDALLATEREYTKAEVPLVQALRQAGAPVSSVWDLVSAGTKRPTRGFRISSDPPEAVWDWLETHDGSYAHLLPLLFEHLQRPYPDAIRDGIARALATPEARPHWKTLMDLYRRESGARTKQGLAVAISAIATDGVLDDVLALARDSEQGESRILLLCALERSRDRRARQALEAFASDPVLGKQARISLRVKARAERRTR